MCDSIVYLCVRASLSLFAAEATLLHGQTAFHHALESQQPALYSCSSVALGSTARTSAVKQYTLLYCHEASPDTSRIQAKSKLETSQRKSVS